MNKEKIVGIVALATLLVSLAGIQQGYANRSNNNFPASISGSIESVSDPSGGCLNLGLSGAYGTVTVSLNRVSIFLQHANPSSTYTVSVGYVQAGGECDGTWQSVGSVNTDSMGSGTLAQGFRLSGGYSVFEFKDSAGSVVYATDALGL